ncbi:MAG: tRNA (guanosine(37)-N1)-methyltransferase TrmD [Bacteroidetes bacterium]|nr:MAG: tRNA (guanosine(37)-N1)-methyltransferase TrmD [Bacteroidota bacterium]
MRIDIISCVPRLLEGPLSHSILKRAQDKGLLEVHVHDLRDYAENKHRHIDDYPFGGGPGMVMMVEPIARCIRALQAERSYDEVIYLSPDGETFRQPLANQLSLLNNLILLAGHYKGVDQRVRDLFITREISIGDYVLSGGELPALVLVDALGRLIPGVLGDEGSALLDAFQDNLLDAPVYTRPADFEGHTVPDVLLSGHQRNIEDWRDQSALDKTRRLRPDLLQE